MSDYADDAIARMREAGASTNARIRALVNQPAQGSSFIALPGGAQLTSIGLQLPESLNIDDYLKVGQGLRKVSQSWRWWIGDFVNYGERKYGEAYAQAIDIFGLDYGSIADCAAVSRRFEFSRRRENLSWSHHRAVMGLDDTAQSQLFAWCEETIAITHAPRSVKMLRDAVHEWLEPVKLPEDKPAKSPEPEPATPTVAPPYSDLVEILQSFTDAGYDHMAVTAGKRSLETRWQEVRDDFLSKYGEMISDTTAIEIIIRVVPPQE